MFTDFLDSLNFPVHVSWVDDSGDVRWLIASSIVYSSDSDLLLMQYNGGDKSVDRVVCLKMGRLVSIEFNALREKVGGRAVSPLFLDGCDLRGSYRDDGAMLDVDDLISDDDIVV